MLVDDKIVENVVKLVESILPSEAKILIVSHTGSRAFGWGAENLDYDFRGVFYVSKTYWDWAHIGIKGYDITMETLEHLKWQIYYRHWTVFYNLSKPVYLNPIFDMDRFLSLCGSDCIKYHLPSIKNEILRLKHVHKSPRAGLHCYKELMIPIYYLKTGKIEINCAKLNEEYFHLEQFDRMLENYKYGRKVEINWDEAIKDYDELLSELENLLEKRNDRLDVNKLNEFIKDIENKMKVVEVKK